LSPGVSGGLKSGDFKLYSDFLMCGQVSVLRKLSI
ncbi:unnamed protein product, partial [Oikopleura dioica]